MSAESSIEAGAPNLNLNAEEKRAYGQLFRQADTEGVGVVTGDIAVKFFEKTKLDSRILGEIWQIADRENRGFLTPAGFGIVLRLIGHAQANREPTPELALQPGPIPRFDGITLAGPPIPQPLQAQGTGGTPIRIPPLTPEKVSQYAGLFERQPLQGGNMLPGDQAKSIFEKSGLPNEMLGRIWQLADTEQRGALVLTEFVIAMHLLTSMKTGALRGLPNVLPAALYEAATRRGSAPRQSPTTTGPPLSAIPRQLSGSAQMRTANPLGRSPLNPQASGSNWLVTPEEKARFDQFFADLDKTSKGYITGEEAVPFLSQSSLSEDALAQIWDLADINSEGTLTRDTFAVAMYLIRQARSRRDGTNVLPVTLPPNLIPPSMRHQVRPPTAVGSPFDAPAPPAPKSALDDLFGLDTPPPAPAPAQVPLSTGGSAAKDPFANASPIAPGSPARPSPPGNQFKAFVPSSSFGKTLTTQDTGGSGSSAAAPRFAPGPSHMSSAMDDLLGDNDPEISKKLTNETAELANLSNQIGSLSNQMQQVQGQRTGAQQEINQANQQKKNFEERLTQLRALYEKEAKDVASLQEQLQKSRDETRKLMKEMATVDATYRDLQGQHQQISAALQADQQENASLKQRISAVNTEIAQLKPQIEKLKSEARQQKGLVAINKKQLSTTEGERDKLKTEVEDVTKSNEDIPLDVKSAAVTSPAPSTASGNNPFFRRTGSTDIMGAFASPPAVKPFGEKSFDDIFGEFGGSTSSTPPPPTSFKAQTTGTSTASVDSFVTPATSTPTVSRQATLSADPPAAPLSNQVSPPMSRVGDGNPLEPAVTGQSVTSTADTNKTTTTSMATDERPAIGVAASNGNIPGAFPDETPKSGDNAIDPFDKMEKDPASAKDDFDSAFASYKSSTAKSKESAKETNNAFATFNTEFPPISELERDDDSDSASEGNGFDDDFAPASPTSKKTNEKDTPRAPLSPATAVPDVPAAEGASSPMQNDTSPFAQPQTTAASVPSQPKANDPFAPASDLTVTNTAPPAAKGAFEDLDDDFAGLEDAKEGSADDEFANISRSGLDDFNPVFDSSPPPSQLKSESTNVSNAFGIDSSYDFGSVSATSADAPAPAPATSPGQTGPKASDNHDWDAIFASLDDTGSAPTKTGDENKSPTDTRPTTLGRVLTEDGAHDDPILKNLTSMGYTRHDALSALEKYDYNLERAANYLASQS